MQITLMDVRAARRGALRYYRYRYPHALLGSVRLHSSPDCSWLAGVTPFEIDQDYEGTEELCFGCAARDARAAGR